MIPGMPGGRQFAVVLSSGCGAFAAAALIASYSGVNDGPAAADPRPPRAAPAAPLPSPGGGFPRGALGAVPKPGLPPPATPDRSQTPLKSGNFARAVQSAGVGAL